jgi:anti-anti-sigma factor
MNTGRRNAQGRLQPDAPADDGCIPADPNAFGGVRLRPGRERPGECGLSDSADASWSGGILLALSSSQEETMSATAAPARTITAPEELGLETRLAFRELVTRELAGLPVGAVLVLDLAGTRRVDSAGLSAMMLVQRQAQDRAQRIVLRHPSEELRFLLALTLMTDLFEFEPARP